MLKPSSLRAALVAALPALGPDPDKLRIFVDEGRIVSRRTKGLGYEYRYQLRLFLEAFTQGPDAVMVPLLVWMRTHQPDLLLRFEKEDKAIAFAADILDEQSWDLAITFELTEAVRLVERTDGSGWDMDHLAEPSPDDPLLYPDLAGVGLAELSLGGTQILPRS